MATDVDQISKEVLKSLCLEYQQDLSPETFSKILLRVDKLVMYVAWGCINKLPHLQKEDIQDVYDAAILGLFAGIKKVKVDEVPDIVIAKFIAYMKCEIRKEFPYRPELSMDWADLEETDAPIYQTLEFEVVERYLDQLVEENICTPMEISVMKAHVMYDIPYNQLATQHDVHIDSVRKMTQDCVGKVRHQFRIRGIEVM